MIRGNTPGGALGLYLSIPFCRSKCTFCNFASGVYPASELSVYVSRVLEDLANARANAEGHGLALPAQVDTVYFGGGTPSILSPVQLRAVFTSIRKHFEVQADAEVTLEAAPAMLADDLLAAAVESGVTRISFGVQTFVDSEARAVGRLHSTAEALDDIARARRAGIRAVNVDLIAGLPGQTEASWQRSLATLGEAAPEHASIYMLEIDEDSRLGGEMLLGGTRYGAGLTPSDDAVADFYSEACSVLASQGLRQYEISNFARPGHESLHNMRYWERRPYLGLGLDAHSMLRSAAGSVPLAKRAIAGRTAGPGSAVRFGATDHLASYLKAARPWGEMNRLTIAEELEEAWFLGLRLSVGVSLAALRAEFGAAAVEAYDSVLATLVEDGLVTRTTDWAALTHRGRMLSNEVFVRFLGLAESEQQTIPGATEIPLSAVAAR